ncbi:L,D-transpeptidase [Streptomyces sp. NPDC049099]|uniref:L,D-transpeptidase n=1 Tax=Streptomyces sp. NPDC049099 TaxID=3155768 RepID=UPI00341AEA1B
MSDQPPPHPLTEAELSARLRDLAAHGAAPAPATGAQVRSRAQRRRRGRRVVLSSSALAAAALATVTSGALGSSAKPATPPATSVSHTPTPAPSPAPVQRVTIDLDAHTLTIKGRRFPISAPQKNCPIGEKTVTVTAKYPTLTLRPYVITKYPDVKQWAITFTDRSHHQRLLMWALDPSAGLASIGDDAPPGSIALAPEAGKWVYDAVKPGARVEIKGRQAKSADPGSTCTDRQSITRAP